MAETELKPCPFCGKKLEQVGAYYLHPQNECFLLHLAIDVDDTKAIKAWNERV